MNDSEYDTKADNLYAWGSDLFRGLTDESDILKAAKLYYDRGVEEGHPYAALVDYLGVSTPSVLSTAGFTDDEIVDIMEIIAEKL